MWGVGVLGDSFVRASATTMSCPVSREEHSLGSRGPGRGGGLRNRGGESRAQRVPLPSLPSGLDVSQSYSRPRVSNDNPTPKRTSER